MKSKTISEKNRGATIASRTLFTSLLAQGDQSDTDENGRHLQHPGGGD